MGVLESFDTFGSMFVRKKKNKSGVISIQVIDKSSGKYRVIKTIGSSAQLAEIDILFGRAQTFIKEQQKQSEIDFNNADELFSSFISGIKQINVAGSELLLGKIFDEIGFSKVKDELFRKLVIARLCFPYQIYSDSESRCPNAEVRSCFNVGNLSSGTYFLELRDEKNTYRAKFIKQ